MDFRAFKPCLLVSTPELADPNFHQSVVLLTEFTPEGALGFVINRPSAHLIGDTITIPGHEINPAYLKRPLWSGGPVEPNRIWIVYDAITHPQGSGLPLGDNVALARDVAILTDAKVSLGECELKIINGYAGWAAKQLDQEIAASAWIVCPLSKQLAFYDTPAAHWHATYRALGIDANTVVTPHSPFLN